VNRRWTWILVAAAAAGMAGAVTVAIGCSRDQATERRITELTEPEDALREELMIPLAQAQNYHHIADVHLKDGKPEKAIVAVRQILTLSFPPDSPEGADVAADARARLGKLLVAAGRLDEAAQVVDEGIAIARRESFFVANLHSVRGSILDARADRIAASDAAGAEELRRSAIEAHMRSNQILDQLLERRAGEPSP
jgi:hypothetical protein